MADSTRIGPVSGSPTFGGPRFPPTLSRTFVNSNGSPPFIFRLGRDIERRPNTDSSMPPRQLVLRPQTTYLVSEAFSCEKRPHLHL